MKNTPMKVPTALFIDAFLDANGCGNLPVSALRLGTFEHSVKTQFPDLTVDYTPEALKAAAEKFPQVFSYDTMTLELSRPIDYASGTPLDDYFKDEGIDDYSDRLGDYCRLYDSSIVKWYNSLCNNKDFALMRNTGSSGINFPGITLKRIFETVNALGIIGRGHEDDVKLKDLYGLLLRNMNSFTLGLEDVGAVVSAVCDIDEDNDGNDTLNLADVFYGKYVNVNPDGSAAGFFDSQGIDTTDELVSIVVAATLMLHKIFMNRSAGYDYIRISRGGDASSS